MSALVPVEKHGLAIFSTARYDVAVDTDSRPLEVYERFLPFDETLGSAATPFTRALEGPFKPDSTTRMQRDVPPGMIYQARLYVEEGDSELGDPSIATQRGEAHKPQLRLEPGGTYVSTTIAAGGVLVLNPGEANFSLTVADDVGPQTDTFFWPDMDTAATSHTSLSIVSSGPRAAGRVAYAISAVEDDSGFPPDHDDPADTGLPHTIAFRRGEGQETFTEARTLEGFPTTSGEELRFLADVVWDVSYS